MKKILVVDNDPFIVEFMKDILSGEGNEVVTAGDGLSALDMLERYTPDFIFVDLIMPNIDGKKLCKLIRGKANLRSTFLTILSGTVAEDEVDLEQLGVNACIVKGPFDEMSRNVLGVIEDPEHARALCLSGHIIGLHGNRPQAVTKELLSVKRHFEIILEKMSEGIMEITREGRVLYANPTALELLREPEERLLGSDFAELFTPPDDERVKGLLNTLSDAPVCIEDDAPLALENFSITLNVIPISSDDFNVIVILNDITRQKKTEEALRQSETRYRELSITDALTQLHNSRHFFSQFEVEVERANRYTPELSLLLLDLDDFKRYNDQYGHVEGDKVLRKLGQVISRSLRQTDSAYRYGGEEFTVILPGTVLDDALLVSERIRKTFEMEPFYPPPGDEVHMTASIGVTQYRSGEALAEFLERADQLMYTAKKQGKNRVVSAEEPDPAE